METKALRKLDDTRLRQRINAPPEQLESQNS
jgi:hypothetical protein